MTEDQWDEVDHYLSEQFLEDDTLLDQVLAASAKAGLPDHSVAPNQGKLLALLVQSTGARRVLEIGTLGGYSTIWLGRALPDDGKLDTLEANANHAKVARDNITRAGLSQQVSLHEGPATSTLEAFIAENVPPYYFIFIDADKPNNPAYLEAALALSRPGTLIVVDNVVRNGAVIDSSSHDPKVQGVRLMNQVIASNPQLTATAIQTVGSKGWDGFVLIRVEAEQGPGTSL